MRSSVSNAAFCSSLRSYSTCLRGRSFGRAGRPLRVWPATGTSAGSGGTGNTVVASNSSAWPASRSELTPKRARFAWAIWCCSASSCSHSTHASRFCSSAKACSASGSTGNSATVIAVGGMAIMMPNSRYVYKIGERCICAGDSVFSSRASPRWRDAARAPGSQCLRARR